MWNSERECITNESIGLVSRAIRRQKISKPTEFRLVQPTSDEYNILFRVMGAAASTTREEIEKIKQEMQGYGIASNSTTYSEMIRVAVNKEDWEWFDQLYTEIKTLKKWNVMQIQENVWIQIIRGMVKREPKEQNEFEGLIHELKDEIEQNEFSQKMYNFVLLGCSAFKNVNEMLEWAREMEIRGIPKNSMTYELIFGTLQRELKDDKFCEHSKYLMEVAAKVFMGMKMERVYINNRIITNVIKIFFLNKYGNRLDPTPIRIRISQYRGWNILMAKLLQRENMAVKKRQLRSEKRFDEHMIAVAFNVMAAKGQLRHARALFRIFEQEIRDGLVSDSVDRKMAASSVVSAYLGVYLTNYQHFETINEFNRIVKPILKSSELQKDASSGSNSQYSAVSDIKALTPLFDLAIESLVHLKDWNQVAVILDLMKKTKIGIDLNAVYLILKTVRSSIPPNMLKTLLQTTTGILSQDNTPYQFESYSSRERMRDKEYLKRMYDFVSTSLISHSTKQHHEYHEQHSTNKQLAKQLFNTYIDRFDLNIYICNAMLTVYMRSNEISNLFAFWNFMLSENIRPDTVSFTILTQAIYKTTLSSLRSSSIISVSSDTGFNSVISDPSGKLIPFSPANFASTIDTIESLLFQTSLQPTSDNKNIHKNNFQNSQEHSQESYSNLKFDLYSLTLFLQIRTFMLTLKLQNKGGGKTQSPNNLQAPFPATSSPDPSLVKTLELLQSIHSFKVVPDLHLYKVIRSFFVTLNDDKGLELINKEIHQYYHQHYHHH
ncbi:hypothetical protein AX774_g3877 [Zancudomyces culisetae]|uniref:Pentatricopeptide repeat-containing protein n=1 Tax=Zancudomyces culisetae TaxID=1213189 RepID=A0A1R1PNV4_ZANCU|nr:hypothetical protein AX774_g3877 [Zancudomyces culisetae]|eukprot:OMH82638.1 hypothetical protein AX774_g3877 [Zancudomyces culisetae]